MDWFKGKFTGNPRIYQEIYGFWLKFSLQSMDWDYDDDGDDDEDEDDDDHDILYYCYYYI